jgi:hypothetical protein
VRFALVGTVNVTTVDPARPLQIGLPVNAERLSGLVAAFVALDRPTIPFVVGAILRVDREPVVDAADSVHATAP